MPIIRVTIAAGRTQEQKRAAAEGITATLVETCGAHAEHVYVLFEEIERDEWMVGGETITMRMKKRGEL